MPGIWPCFHSLSLLFSPLLFFLARIQFLFFLISSTPIIGFSVLRPKRLMSQECVSKVGDVVGGCGGGIWWGDVVGDVVGECGGVMR